MCVVCVMFMCVLFVCGVCSDVFVRVLYVCEG